MKTVRKLIELSPSIVSYDVTKKVNCFREVGEGRPLHTCKS